MKSFYKHITIIVATLFISTLVSIPKVTLGDQVNDFDSMLNVPIQKQEINDLENNLILQLKDASQIDEILDVLPADTVVSAFENVKTISVEMDSEEELQSILNNNGLSKAVSDVYEDAPVYMYKVPYDSMYSLQWNLPRINMENAWDKLVVNKRVVVAVVDSGVTRYNDMQNLINGADLSSGTINEDTYPGQYSYDGDVHGTAVSAGIAAQHNSIGIAGINPGVSIMGVKVFADGAETSSSTTIAAGVRWAADHGAEIINLSVGSNSDVSSLRSAISYAASKGILIVAASGNDGYSNMISYPAAYPNVIAVGSTDQSDKISYFSNKGQQLDIVAPGEDIPLPNIALGEESYRYFNGTSFSSPTVAGVGSLLLSKYPELTSTQIENILKMSARDIGTTGWDSSSGYGIVDASNALNIAESYNYFDENVSFETAQEIYPNINYEGHIAPAGDSDYYKFTIQDGYDLQIASTSPSELDLVLRLYNTDGYQLEYKNETFIGQNEVLTTYLNPGTYYISVEDYFKKISSSPYSIQVNIEDQTSPTIHVFNNNGDQVFYDGLSQGESTILINDTSTYEWEVFRDGQSIGAVNTVSEEGNYEIAAVDRQGNRTEFNFVLDNDGFLSVSFETGTTNIVPDQYAYYNSPINFPEVFREHYIFKGWYTEEERINLWGANYQIKKNMTLYAGWEVRQLDSIEITQIPDKVRYYVDDKLDITGLKVVAKYNDGSTEPIELSNITVSGFDSSKAADDQTIKLTYDRFTVAYFIDVAPKILESLEIIGYPIKNTYVVGQSFDSQGLVIEGIYNNGTRNILALTSNNISGFDSSKVQAGQIVTVQVGDKTASFNVDIIERRLTHVEMKASPKKLIYNIGDSIELSGMIIEATFNDGITEVVPYGNLMVLGFDSSNPVASQTVTIEFETWRFTFNVTVKIFPTMEILAGSNRFSTATAISKASYDQADTAILVQASNFPDALSAGPLAYALNAPILLTNTQGLSNTTKVELERLGVKKVILMGGESAISKDVEDTLNNILGYEVERVAGSNRYGTAVAAAAYLKALGVSSDTVILASGTEFADALSIGSYASRNGYPILLTNGNRISQSTLDYLSNPEIGNILIVGGTSVVESSLENELGVLGKKVERISGTNRFNTSVAIGRTMFKNATVAIMANGYDFADALAAAPYAARINAPILLVNQNRINAGMEAYLPESELHRIIIVGGEAAVGAEVKERVYELLIR